MKKNSIKEGTGVERSTNFRLKARMEELGYNSVMLAELVHYSDRQVRNWIAGELPHPQIRLLVAEILNVSAKWLWSEDAFNKDLDTNYGEGEIIRTWSTFFDCPDEYWWNLFVSARHHIDILAFETIFLNTDNEEFVSMIAEQHNKGIEIRFILPSVCSPAALSLDRQDDYNEGLINLIYHSLSKLQPITKFGAQVFIHNLALPSSIFRFDDDILVLNHLNGVPIFEAPLIHLRRVGAGGIFDRYASQLNQVLANDAWPITDELSGDDSTSIDPTLTEEEERLMTEFLDRWPKFGKAETD